MIAEKIGLDRTSHLQSQIVAELTFKLTFEKLPTSVFVFVTFISYHFVRGIFFN